MITTFCFSFSLADVESSYDSLYSELEGFLEALKKNKETETQINKLLADTKTTQLDSESITASSSDSTMKLGNQSSAFVRAEILRGESSILKNKQLIIELSRLSYELSKKEIKKHQGEDKISKSQKEEEQE